MTLWRRQQRHRRPAVLAAIVLGAITIGVGTLIVALAATTVGGDGDDQARQKADAAVGASTRILDSGTVPAGSTRGAVQLPVGADQVDGYPIGFPHNDVGAVAATVEFNRAQIGFDYDQAATIAGVYAAPDDVASIEVRARESVANRRRHLGVDPTGSAPAPTAFALTPFAFTLEEFDDDAYAVTVLSLATTTNTSGEVRNLYYSGTQLVRWVSLGETESGDWKVVEPTAEEAQQIASLPALPAVGPEDPRFEQSGWIAIKAPWDPVDQRAERIEPGQ